MQQSEAEATQGNEPVGGAKRRKKKEAIKGVSNTIQYNALKNDPYFTR